MEEEKPIQEEETIDPEIEKQKTKDSGRNLAYIIIGILLIFGSIFAITSIRTAMTPTTIDELHNQNIEGKIGEKNYLYNGYSFVNLDNMWYFQLQQEDIIFDVPLRYGPKDVEDVPINVDLSMIDSEVFPEIYITINPKTTDATYQTLAASELGLNLVRAMNIIPRAACIEEDNITCKNIDIINCSYEFSPIIYIKESNQTQITQENTCYIIEGKGEELLRSIDRFIYKIYNVMPENK